MLSAIAAHDTASEVLVRLLQLVVVFVFGALYAVSPKTDAGTAFSPVPYVLAAYAVFTVAGLFLATRMRLPDLVVYLMTFIDMALLMAMIWSFHIQYQQPPSFYLKAPTLLYVFIFIALRALRFEARFVVAAGLAAMLGWLALVGYAVIIGADHMMVTRNYITYMTTNSILIGAEFDKIIAILSVTLILALAVRRGRGLLIEAVREQMAARALSRFFDPDVAGRIRAAEKEIRAGEGVTRDAAILNIDIRGFTTLAAQMEPGDVVAILSAYQDRLVPIIQKNGGTIDKFMGDGIMASFGALLPTETSAADAMRAVDAIIGELDAWREEDDLPTGFDPAKINMAVASGQVVFGAVGSDDRLELTVIGSAVNLSAKMEKYNKELGSRALATADVVKAAREQGYVPPKQRETLSVTITGTDIETPVVRLY
ncbi:MAG: adenylate/guanylate cyclase domain-containing protein [Tepidamorphaceae bacterium]